MEMAAGASTGASANTSASTTAGGDSGASAAAPAAATTPDTSAPATPPAAATPPDTGAVNPAPSTTVAAVNHWRSPCCARDHAAAAIAMRKLSGAAATNCRLRSVRLRAGGAGNDRSFPVHIRHLIAGVAIAGLAAGAAQAHKAHHHAYRHAHGLAYAAPAQPIPYAQLDQYLRASPAERNSIETAKLLPCYRPTPPPRRP